MIEINKVYNQNCLETMSKMEDNFIDMVLCSPPYDKTRDYLGYSFDFKSIASELYRVLKVGGTMVWVVGDQTKDGSESGTSFIQALYFKELGFNLWDTMIYASEKPPLNHRRYEQQFEYIFVLTKGKPKTFNPIMVECKNAGKVNTGNHRKIETGELVKKHGEGRRCKTHKIHGNIWYYNTGNNKSTKDKIAHKHPAIMPEQLAEDMILSWSNPGDLVYDPFSGVATTAKICILNNRNYIGSEVSEEYCKIGEERLEQTRKFLNSQGTQGD